MTALGSETIIQKPWGHERWLAAFDGRYAVKVIHVDAGGQLSLQRHAHKHETQFYLSGHARVEHGLDADLMESDDVHGDGTIHNHNAITFEPGTWHRITAVSDVTFLEVQTAYEGWTHDVERRSDAYGRQGTTAPVVSQGGNR